ncbi:MAG TPA: hypothetical protein VD884_14625 [Ohtaekwangia sp.]|nr:hypothetical protein [Ohtaekwangia sp.]
MEKADLIKILHHFSGTSTKDAQAILSATEHYPFSQLLHTLSARVSKDHGFSNYEQELQHAAVYAADRGVLKHIMEVEYNPDLNSIELLNRKQQQHPVQNRIDVAEEILTDLEQLRHLKHNFEMMFIDGSATSMLSPGTPELIEDQVKSRDEKEGSKSKKERIKEIAKAYIPADPAENAPPKNSRRLKEREVTDTFINDLVSKQELVPESDKHKEQLQIIEQFIRIQPSISGMKEKESNPSDLSTIRTGEFGDNIISETLVEILLKQGKKDKAIEVLKKLIWKFPQKKAYFATQIEALKK